MLVLTTMVMVIAISIYMPMDMIEWKKMRSGFWSKWRRNGIGRWDGRERRMGTGLWEGNGGSIRCFPPFVIFSVCIYAYN